MRFSPQFLDELSARLPVSEFVGRHVKLRKTRRKWKGQLTSDQLALIWQMVDEPTLFFDCDSSGRRAASRADGASDRETVLAELARRGVADLVARLERAITTPSVWGSRADAAPADVLMTWNQLFALHRQWHSLIKELKDAEQALGRDTTEANYSWLQDVKARLSVIEGTEALIEGFGASSGREAAGF